MSKKPLDAVTLAHRQMQLQQLSQAVHTPNAEETATPQARALFSLSGHEGTVLYESYTDEALQGILFQRAQELGHSPAQQEVFWVYRTYLKKRFGNWPQVLEKAGLSKSAGAGGVSLERSLAKREHYEALLQQVRDAAQCLGRTPHPSDLPEVCAALEGRFRTWGDLLEAAGVRPCHTVYLVEELEPEHRAALDRLRALAEDLGRAPLRSEVAPELRGPLVERCGSWRNALFQIGLEPVVHMTPFGSAFLQRGGGVKRKVHRSDLKDCYYRVLHLEPSAQAALERMNALRKKLGRMPRRGEVPAETRNTLRTACGTWSNALYQLDLPPSLWETTK